MLELLTAKEMGRADKLAVEGGVAGTVLMENAGRSVADEVSLRFPDASTVAILCGPGNNGGDGFVAARQLLERGYFVRLGFDGDPSKLPADAAEMASRFTGPMEPLSPDLFEKADVIVDGLFGAGLARPLEGKMAELVESANTSGIPIIAIDVPSGVDGSTGMILGTAMRALSSVTFFRFKPGHYLEPGHLHCGELHLADIGIPDEVLEDIKPRLYANEPALWIDRYPWPTALGHKYLRGHAVVASGPADATGAARLAARGALRAGAGLVTVASPRNALAVNASHLTAVMLREADGARGIADLLSDTRKNAFLIGPGHGVGDETRHMVLTALRAEPAVVLDADALTSFAESPEILFEAINGREHPVVMTPHAGEFARLFGEVPGASKVDRARTAASRSGATVVLKGPDTVIASPEGHAAIDTNGTPWLATAGSGDAMAGMVLAMLAQGLSGFDAGCIAVWMHGQAAKRFGPGLIAEDLPEMIPEVLEDIEEYLKRA
ncbi:MAG: NAD(P)H-hydrate dehydratase [Methyloceanibacter sp.]|nr:NAD(P)H-hydrate dehydratase [Methyloceanibacter sp.]